MRSHLETKSYHVGAGEIRREGMERWRLEETRGEATRGVGTEFQPSGQERYPWLGERRGDVCLTGTAQGSVAEPSRAARQRDPCPCPNRSRDFRLLLAD